MASTVDASSAARAGTDAPQRDEASTDDGPDIDRQKRARRWLTAQSQSARHALALCVGAGVSNGLLLVVQAGFLAHIVHSVAIDGLIRADLLPSFAALAILYVLRGGCVWLAEVAGVNAATRVKSTVRSELLAHIAALGPRFVHSRRTGSLIAAVVEQVDALDGYFSRYLPQMVVAAALPLAMLVVVFSVDWVVGIILMVTAPLIPLFMALVGMGAAAANRRQFRALARLSGHFLDRLQGLTTLKLFGQARREMAVLERISDDYRKRTMGVLRLAFLSSAVLEFFSSVSVALVAVYVGLSLLGMIGFGTADSMTLWSGLFVLLLAPDFFLPLRQFAQFYHDRATALSASETLLEIFEETPPSAAGAAPFALTAAPAIALHDVSLQREGNREAPLTNVAFTVAPGERVALIGPSGAGKSTVIGLLMGLEAPSGGDVTVDGRSTASIARDDLMAAVSWIGQTPHLFHGTVRDNIRLARPDADDADVRAAAATAGLGRIGDELPDGLDTLVGERGHGVSGGQAQRIAVARAVLKDAPILLMDEPTASLDLDNERLVLAALAEAVKGRTVVIATHNAAGIDWADRIVRLDRGRTLGDGEG
ncbi:thiol reductant ABC exporter subunit CydD [Fodinicurvata sp. EGI_FJ10296]|uniref:thiol reductant ABC exporter subunit CydD n=1 Tax=Fodinicurvata sp. EGI_FJ10296 TaxID=3231908 RepID=UPI0034515629